MRPSVPASAERRAYLRTVSLGVPGLLLTGWAPASALPRPVSIALPRDTGPVSAQLRAGVAMGVLDVTEAARVLGVSLDVRRGDAAAEAFEAVPVVASDVDAHDGWDHAGMLWPRIHTCRLTRWRPGAWSVASPLLPGPPTCDWHAALHAHGAAGLNARFARHAGFPMDQRAWRGWMAVKVAFDVALRRAAGERELRAMQFDGHKGQPLRFGEDAHLEQPTYLAGRV